MDRLEKFSDPRVIPLPSSPPPRTRIPSRRPPGWVSTLPDLAHGDEECHDSDGRIANRSLTGRGVDESQNQGLGRGQSASALRTRHAIAALGHGRPNGSLATDTMMTSTAVRVSGPSRRVSSTMSYALIAQSRAASSAFRTVSTSQARGIQTSDSAHSVVSCAHVEPQRRPSTPNDIPPTPALTDARTISSTTFPVSPSVPQTPTSQRSSYSRSWGASDTDRAEIRVASTREVYAYEAELNTSSPPACPALVARIPSPIRESQSPLERPEWLEEVLEERRADEEWMHYVRAQLGALFPDFVDSPADIGSDADQPQRQRQANTGDEAASVSSPHVGEVASPMTIGPDNWANAEQAGRTVINSIPSVRSEINELRDEIERLRGVVGGLASDLSAVPAGIQRKDAEAVVHLAQPGQPESRSMAASGPDVGDEEDRVAVEGLLVGEDEQDKYELRMAMESDSTSVGMPKAVDVRKAVDTASTRNHDMLAEILGSLTRIFPRTGIDKPGEDVLFSSDHLAHLQGSLRQHLCQ